MAGLIFFASVGLYLYLGSWGFKGIKNGFGYGAIDASGIVLFVAIAALIGFVVSYASFSFYANERVYAFSLMAGYAIKCPLIIIIPFLMFLGISVEQKSGKCRYIAKVIAASLIFNVVYFIVLQGFFASHFGISTYN